MPVPPCMRVWWAWNYIEVYVLWGICPQFTYHKCQWVSLYDTLHLLSYYLHKYASGVSMNFIYTLRRSSATKVRYGQGERHKHLTFHDYGYRWLQVVQRVYAWWQLLVLRLGHMTSVLPGGTPLCMIDEQQTTTCSTWMPLCVSNENMASVLPGGTLL